MGPLTILKQTLGEGPKALFVGELHNQIIILSAA